MVGEGDSTGLQTGDQERTVQNPVLVWPHSLRPHALCLGALLVVRIELKAHSHPFVSWWSFVHFEELLGTKYPSFRPHLIPCSRLPAVPSLRPWELERSLGIYSEYGPVITL